MPWIKKVAANSTRIVAVGNNNGATWTVREQTMRDLYWEQLIFDGENFITWGNYYTRQKSYRSVDGGLTWSLLPATAFR